MKTNARMWSALPMAMAALMLGFGAPMAWADDNEDEKPFAEARLFFELNNTDGDLGIHALIDGDPWKRLKIEDPRERTLLDVSVLGRLRRQGLTELFFESAEPSFDELSPEEFFDRFPEGEYEIEGKTLEGEELESTVELSHVMPGPPSNVMVSGEEAAPSCDDELPVVGEPVMIDWDEVEESHPGIGTPGVQVEIELYQLVIEREDPLLVFSVDLPSDVTEFEIPAALTESGQEIKFEIIARAEGSGNQTAVESCFVVE